MFKNFTHIFKTIKPRLFSTIVQKTKAEIELEYRQILENKIAVIGLNRAKQKNAISKSFLQEFNDAINRVKTDKDVRVVIVRSLIPKIFCAGADLKERLTLTDQEVQAFVCQIRQTTQELENLPIPSIAAIDGAALGGGLEFSLACDLRVASDTARLGLVETKLAIIPGGGGTQRLPRLIGPALAKELIFTGRILGGFEAEKYGIVNCAVKQNDRGDAAFNKALEIAEEIAPNGPIGVRMAKRSINKGLELDLSSGLIVEEACYAQIVPTKDRIEGLLAFKDKRKPLYRGE